MKAISKSEVKTEVNSGQSQPKDETSLWLQIILSLITLTIIGYLTYPPISQFDSLDIRPTITPITPAVLEKFKDIPNVVKVGLFIYDFPKFDILTNDFVFNGVIFFEFDPAVLTLETLSKFTFAKGKITYKSEPDLHFHNNLIFARYDIRVEFKTNLNHRMFPFTDHRVSFALDNEFLYPEEIIFDVTLASFIVDPSVYISGWQEYNRGVTSGYTTAQLESYNPDSVIRHPRVSFVIEYIRDGLKEIISILLPLFLLFFLSVFSFAMDPKKYFHSIIGLSTGSVTGMLSYKYVIDRLSPQTSYFMFSDVVYFVFLIIIIFIFLCNSHAYDLTVRQKRWISIGLHVIVNFTFIYLFKFWN